MLTTKVLGRHVGGRSFATVSKLNFLGNMFGSRDKKRQEIIANQDEYEVDPNSKIVFLNEENSESHKVFDAAQDIPGFRIVQWKDKIVRARDIEQSVTKNMVEDAINTEFHKLHGSEISAKEYATTRLDDLEKRFMFVKALQQRLGFDIKDHTISRSHTLEYLFESLRKQIAHRWSNERNPNAIVLREEDFEGSSNIYLNAEHSEQEQNAMLDELKQKASLN